MPPNKVNKHKKAIIKRKLAGDTGAEIAKVLSVLVEDEEICSLLPRKFNRAKYLLKAIYDYEDGVSGPQCYNTYISQRNLLEKENLR